MQESRAIDEGTVTKVRKYELRPTDKHHCFKNQLSLVALKAPFEHVNFV